MKVISLHRVAILLSFTRFLEEIGTPVERAFQRAGLPFAALENIDNYVPSHRFWSFLVDTSYREGIPDLGYRVGMAYGANSADPKLSKILRQSPSLYSGLLEASELTNKTVTNCHVGIAELPYNDYLQFYHLPSCDAHNPVIDQIGWFGLTALIGMVRVFTGPNWSPPEIGLMTNPPLCVSVYEQFPHTQLRFAQPYSYIAIEKKLLSLPPCNLEVTVPASSPLRYQPFSYDFVGSLKQSLSAYLHDGDIDIQLAAELCNTSKRSLQRKLAESSTSFSKVLESVWFDAACDMLCKLDIKVIDIAQTLGYSDSSHFTRAFRRIAGVNPSEYRQHHNAVCT
jgi:AraC-like DNA-binding protein